MPITEAQKKAVYKYRRDKIEEIRFQVPKGEKQKIKDFAAKRGQSLSQFVYDAVKKEMGKEE